MKVFEISSASKVEEQGEWGCSYIIEETVNWYITLGGIWQYLVKLNIYVVFNPNMSLLSFYLKVGVGKLLL